MGTAAVPIQKALQHHASIRGYSLVEVIVAMGIFAVVARIAIPHFDARRMRINTAQQLVASSLRLARAKAITKSVHYRVDFTNANQLQVAPMIQDVNGNWSIDDTQEADRCAAHQHTLRRWEPVRIPMSADHRYQH